MMETTHCSAVENLPKEQETFYHARCMKSCFVPLVPALNYTQDELTPSRKDDSQPGFVPGVQPKLSCT